VATPFIEAAKKIADAFEVSLDYLVREGIKFDKNIQAPRRFRTTQRRKEKDFVVLIDTYMTDAKSLKA
jgi:hypothetical protein